MKDGVERLNRVIPDCVLVKSGGNQVDFWAHTVTSLQVHRPGSVFYNKLIRDA